MTTMNGFRRLTALLLSLLLSITTTTTNAASSSYHCSICGNLAIGNNTTIIVIQDSFNKTRHVTCPRAEYLINSYNGPFPHTSAYCSKVQAIAKSHCNCIVPATAGPSPSSAKTPSPTPAATTAKTSSPTAAATTAAPVAATMAPTPVVTSAASAAATTMAPTAAASAAKTMAPTPAASMAATTMAPTTGAKKTGAPSKMAATMAPSKMAATMAPTMMGTHANNTSTMMPMNGTMAPTNGTMNALCNGMCHTHNMTVLDINTTIANIASKGLLCVCPGNYSDVCPSDTAEPAIVINGGQDIVMECVAGQTSTTTCTFGCPGVIVHVRTGGSLTLTGNAALEMTGGVVYSRLVVEEGATVDLNAVIFSNTSCAALPTTTKSRRSLITELADGMGGAIYSKGTMTIDNSNFEKCDALFDGGAIWAGNSSNTTIYSSTFTTNTAGVDGGAIYSDGALYIKNSFFTNNKATADSGVGGTATVHGCGNQGIPTFSCNVGQGTSDAAPGMISLLSHAVALIVPVLLFYVSF